MSKQFTIKLRRNISILLTFGLLFNSTITSAQEFKVTQTLEQAQALEQVKISAQALSTSALCSPPGYTVGFFNGVWNTYTEDEALAGMNALRVLIGDIHNNAPVEYETFYNTTGSTAGATGAQDVAEVFIQRSNEFDTSGELSKRFEYFWEAASDGDKPFFSRLKSTMIAEVGIFDGLYSAVTTKAMSGWSQLLSNPPTAVNYTSHKTRLDTLAVEGQQLLLVAHSQGNLFVNNAFDYVKPKIGASSVAVVHIAPASITKRGDYILASIDLVINGLRTQGLFSVLPTNINILPSFSDLSGHTLVETYLDPSRAARGEILTMAQTALNTLTAPIATASRGFFTATLTWDGAGDVDLHTFDPANNHVYYASRSSTTGYLDVDNTSANGPEHFFASCDPSKLLAGNYKIGINNYSGATGRTATVQISFAQGGSTVTKSLSVGAELGSSGNATPIQAITVNVQKDANGKFTATAN